MKKLSLLPLTLLALLTITYSCKKDRIETPEPEQLTAYEPINSYLDSKKQQEQEFIITQSSPDTIVGNQGTRIYGAKNCLQDANLDTVDYPFSIKLVELYTPKDMIYWQMPTMASSNALQTGGEIRLLAEKNSQPLTLKPSCPYGIDMPSTAPASGMTVYYGSDNGTYVNWTNSSTPFATNSYGYQAYINTLGWINCDQPAGTGGHSISFTSTVDDLSNVGIFIYIPASKTVVQAYGQTAASIPSGSSVKIVLMAQNSNGDLFSWTDTRTINNNTSIDIVLNTTTDAALTSYLNGL